MLRKYDITDEAGTKVGEQEHDEAFSPVLMQGQTAVITGEREPEPEAELVRAARAKPAAKSKAAPKAKATKAEPTPESETPAVTVIEPVPETE